MGELFDGNQTDNDSNVTALLNTGTSVYAGEPAANYVNFGEMATTFM